MSTFKDTFSGNRTHFGERARLGVIHININSASHALNTNRKNQYQSYQPYQPYHSYKPLISCQSYKPNLYMLHQTYLIRLTNYTKQYHRLSVYKNLSNVLFIILSTLEFIFHLCDLILLIVISWPSIRMFYQSQSKVGYIEKVFQFL